MSSPEVVQMCCLIDEGERCQSRATGATFNRKLFKTALQRRQRLYADLEAGHNYVCEHHRILLHGMRAKRKRKDSEEEGDYQPEVSCC